MLSAQMSQSRYTCTCTPSTQNKSQLISGSVSWKMTLSWIIIIDRHRPVEFSHFRFPLLSYHLLHLFCSYLFSGTSLLSPTSNAVHYNLYLLSPSYRKFRSASTRLYGVMKPKGSSFSHIWTVGVIHCLLRGWGFPLSALSYIYLFRFLRRSITHLSLCCCSHWCPTFAKTLLQTLLGH